MINCCYHCRWVLSEHEQEYRYNNASYCESCYYLLWADVNID